MGDNWVYREERRKELIAGKVVAMSSSPGWNYMAVSGNIYIIFANYLSGKRCIPILGGCDLYLDDKNRFVPDFTVVCDTDKIYKKEVYARCGVREYWLVSPGDKFVEVYRSDGGKFTLHDVYALYADWELAQMSEKERAAVVTRFKCSLFDDLEISLEDIFYRMI